MNGIWIDPRWSGEESYRMKQNRRFVDIFRKMDDALLIFSKKERVSYINLGNVLASTNNI
jgi:hypothetical protein